MKADVATKMGNVKAKIDKGADQSARTWQRLTPTGPRRRHRRRLTSPGGRSTTRG